METFLGRYRNLCILVGILFAQVLGLAVQVRRSSDSESTRLIRVWAVGAVTPFEKSIVWAQNGVSNLWHNYFYLRGVRQENRNLKYEIQQLQLEQVRLTQDADQAHRLQALLGFKEKYIAKTLAAQVIGFSGSELSRAVYIDKGSNNGLVRDMAVITPDGIVGRILQVYRSTALVLLVNDQTSGVGVYLEKSRLQGVLKGTPAGGMVLEKMLEDGSVQPGEKVLTSGGDRIFPKGLPAGTVTSVSREADSFLNIRVRPAADLGKLEEVLVIAQEEDKTPVVNKDSELRAIDILVRRLPSVPDQPSADANKPAADTDKPPAAAAKPEIPRADKPQVASNPSATATANPASRAMVSAVKQKPAATNKTLPNALSPNPAANPGAPAKAKHEPAPAAPTQ